MSYRFRSSLVLVAIAVCTTFTSVSAFAQDESRMKILPPEQAAIVKALGATKPMVRLSKEWQNQKIVFTNVSDHMVGAWAWFQATPQTEDGKQHFDSVSGVMHQANGQWKLVEFVSDDIASGNEPDKAFRTWSKKFVQAHHGCPAEIFPSKF